jgi:type I restriction enzyme S subunit
MKTAIIRSTWMNGYGYRLDCQPYLSGGLEAKLLLEQVSLKKEKLSDVTTAIYHAGRESRLWVDSPEFGVPFISGSDLQRADLHGLPLISKKQIALNPRLLVRSGYTLITRSGTIGKMAYARRDMDGMACSEHVLRVAADTSKIPSGYLYAYLGSKFGLPLVVSGTYGSMIQSIEPEHIADLPVPRVNERVELKIHNLIEQAAELRVDAAFEINETTESLREFLGIPLLKNANVRGFGISNVSSMDLNFRLDATYHSPIAEEADRALRRCSVSLRRLADPEVTVRLFKPPMFKRMWVTDPREGAQFVSGNDAYSFQAEDVRYVSFLTPKFGEFLVHEGWLVFQAAGQIYGLFGRPLFIHGWLNGLFVADDMYRVVPNDPIDGAYLYTFFRTDVGQVLIKRQSAGNSIPRVWDPQMTQLSVPWPDREDRHRFGKRIIAAHEKLFQALQNEQHAIQILEEAIEKDN